MKRLAPDQSDRLRQSAQEHSDSLRIWQMLRHRERVLDAQTDHPLIPREPGLGICARCGLDRINHPEPKATA